MSTSAVMVMGERGRVVVPQEIRRAQGLKPGDRLVVIEDPSGMTVLTRDQLRARVQANYSAYPSSLADELIHERRVEASREEAAR